MTSPDWLTLLTLALVLGVKHGLDADHLATIDGLTRFNSQQRQPVARYCGSLFSLGHGAVVVAIALGVSTVAARWQVPAWMATFGALVSIGFLLALGLVNLMAVLRTPPHLVVQAIGIKGRLLGRLRHVSHPALVALIGALFALSFDTLSQAAFFALSAGRFGGWPYAAMLALVFMLGMLLTDGLNGLWISRLIHRADRTARLASRFMSLAVASLSLMVAMLGLARLLWPAVSDWTEGKELALGLAVIVAMAVCYLLALRMSPAGSDVHAPHSPLANARP